MEHVKRLVLVPELAEHMVEQRKKPLTAPLTTQVNEIDSDMQDIIHREDIPIDEKAKLYDQNLQRYLTFYDKRMNKPLRVNVIQPPPGEPQGEQPTEETEASDEIETDIMDSVPATMKSSARQLIKKLKSNKDLIGWNEQGQMVFKGRSVPTTNIVDLVNDSLRQRKNFNPSGWELFSKVLGHLNVPEGIVRNENRLGIVREYKTKGIPEHLPSTPRVQEKKKNVETILVVHING
jgi:hypothetical protein